MFNRSEILRDTWADYRNAVKRGFIPAGKVDRHWFGIYLRATWERAKYLAALSARRAAVDALRTCERETVLRNQLLGIECAERMDWAAYNAVNAEIAQLRAA